MLVRHCWAISEAKPVVLNPFHQIEAGPQIRLSNRSTGPAVNPLISRAKENERIYQRVFPALQLPALECQRPWALNYLSQQARAGQRPRHLFDAANECVRGRKIAILPTARCKDHHRPEWWETKTGTWPRTLSVQCHAVLSKHWRRARERAQVHCRSDSCDNRLAASPESSWRKN